ncbi:hypothetical protein EIP86_000461 [Pleurotus ostreatoroseus]|nr:hypothetical protein EIP86_000461 [Pleurotus ostreatoroseus]
MPPKADINKAGWEQSLGDNAFVRMSKQEFGRACGTCARPFTVFRWNPGSGMRYKTTVICQTCAKVKNVCQTCLLDLEYGLPTQVRDTALAVQNEAPTSDINREYYAQNMETKMEGDKSTLGSSRASTAGKEMLKQLARTDPYYKRNRPHLCSFYAKGECNRGDECPYRHEMPVKNELSNQNIQDRYHGQNDPVAKKIMNNYASNMGLTPPEDQTITSIFLTTLPTTATEQSIRTRVLQSLTTLTPAQIKSIVHVEKSRCAFVNFTDRASAELAAAAWAGGFEIDDQKLGVKWGRSRPAKAKAQEAPTHNTSTEQPSTSVLTTILGLNVLHKDLLSLFTLIYATTTKVSLALKPPQPAYSACLPQLQDLARKTSALTTCATLFDEAAHGATLVRLVRGAVRNVLGSVAAYAHAFSDITQKDGDNSGNGGSGEDYLVRTGAVHDAIEQARQEVPKNNVDAVRTLWGRDREMLEDSLNEVTEMLEEEEDEEEDEDDFGDEDEDEWDELGLGKKKKMTEVELDRTKSIHPLLRLCVLLHKRIQIDLLQKASKQVAENTKHSPVDALPALSHNLLLATEELVAALYAPQDLPSLRAAVETLVKEAQTFRPALQAAQFLSSESALDDLPKKMHSLTTADVSAEPKPESADEKKRRETQKWFDTCFDQVDKVSQKVLAGLRNDES